MSGMTNDHAHRTLQIALKRGLVTRRRPGDYCLAAKTPERDVQMEAGHA